MNKARSLPGRLFHMAGLWQRWLADHQICSHLWHMARPHFPVPLRLSEAMGLSISQWNEMGISEGHLQA